MRYLQQKPNAKKIKLDVKDKKIISLLCNNARTPMTQIAKRVALSRDAVAYRIKNYEKRGLVQGYRTMINVARFDYNNYHLFIKLNNPSKELEDKIIKKLTKQPFIRTIIKFSGSYDLEIALIAKDLEDLDERIEKIIDDCEGFVQEHELLTFRKLFVARALPKSFSNYIEDAKVGKKEHKTDKRDIEILKLTSENATLPLYEIGEKIGLSADAVAYRIKNLKNSGIVNKFIPVINYNSLDYNVYVVLLNIASLNAEKEKKLNKFFSFDKNTQWAVKTIGKYNVLAYFLVKNIDELQESIIGLRSLFPGQINQHEILIAYEEYKYTYFPKELF